MSESFKEKLVIVFSFILIFAFNSIDNAVAPLIKPISTFFFVSSERALWLISVCTGGTVVGLLLGPWMLTLVSARRLLAVVLALMAFSQALFALVPGFLLALFFRAVAGFAAGLVASVMWQLTFHGVSKAHFPAMIAVLMSARPLATAIGVPLAGLLAWEVCWQLPVWVIAALTTIAGAALYLFYPEKYASDSEALAPQLSKFSFSSMLAIFVPYRSALNVPYARSYYIGSTINRMAYFGFYAFCGIWFDRHYGLNIKDISLALLVIGLAEALVNFSTGKIIEKFGHKVTFLVSLGLSALVLPVFIYGALPLKAAVGVIALFMLLDRIYSMALVISVPKMFPSTGDKTAFGSLNTLTAWGAMTLVSWFQGQFLQSLGLANVETFIVICFLVGSIPLIWVQQKTVFEKPI